MIYFTNPDGRGIGHETVRDIVAKLADHDEDYWNGNAGQSCLEQRDGEKRRYLYISLAPDASLYWIVFQFADRSKVTPLDPAGRSMLHRLWIGGQPLDVEESRLVDASTARDIIQHFDSRGEPHPDVNWAHT